MMTCAVDMLLWRGRGPPPVPSRIRRVFEREAPLPTCAWARLPIGMAAAAIVAHAPSKNPRLVLTALLLVTRCGKTKSVPSPRAVSSEALREATRVIRRTPVRQSQPPGREAPAKPPSRPHPNALQRGLCRRWGILQIQLPQPATTGGYRTSRPLTPFVYPDFTQE